MRATRRATPDPAARLRALTRRAYTATAGHLDLDDEAGREFDRIISGDGPVRRATAGPARHVPWTADADGGGGGDGHGDGDEVPARTSQEPRDDADPRSATRRADGASGQRSARRWVTSGRAVVVVVAVAAALAGIVVARAIALGPSEPVPAVVDASEVPTADDTSHLPAEPSADGTAPSGSAVDTTVAPPPSSSTTTEAVGEVRASDGSSTAGTGTATQGGVVVVVHVAGAVSDPGVVEVPAGSRVGEAIDAAGGAEPSAELSAVNLARPVQDGEQVYVPEVGEAEPGSAAGGPAAPGGVGTGPAAGGEPEGGGVIDLNTADLAALDTLPGVGPAIAQRILDWRAANGPFHTVEELLEVSGIGPATLERLREQVRV